MGETPKTNAPDLITPYEPVMVYYPEADAAEFLTEDDAHIYEEVAHYVAIVRNMTTRQIVGFRISNPKAWAAYVETT